MICVDLTMVISTPKQANTSTITSTLTSPFNAAITAPTVAKSSSAAQISICCCGR